MKLNTKNLFVSSTRMTPKTTMRKPKKSVLESPLTKIKSSNNKLSRNTNSIKPKSFHYTNKNVNPFIQSSNKVHEIKYIKKEKLPNSQKVISKIDTRGKNNLFENSFINSFLLTSQTDTNDKKLQNNGNNLKNNKKEYDTEEKGNIFKRTSLKSIVDNNGNNNLVLEQKKIINDYFQKVNINTKINSKNFIRPK